MNDDSHIDLNNETDRKAVLEKIATLIKQIPNRGISTKPILAAEILNRYIERTEEHIKLVRNCGLKLIPFIKEKGISGALFEQELANHDHDKLDNFDIVPIYAAYTQLVYNNDKYKDTCRLEDGVEKEFNEVACPLHYKLNSHHVGEHFGKLVDGCYVVESDRHFVEIAHMVADWMAMGMAMNNSATAWWSKCKQENKYSFKDEDIAWLEKLLLVENDTKQVPIDAGIEDIHPNADKQIVNGLVYHGSPVKTTILKANKNKAHGNRHGVFVSPFKGIAACFVPDEKKIIERLKNQGIDTTSINFQYSKWNEDYETLQELPNPLEIYLGNPAVKEFKGVAHGYIYTIDYSKYKDKSKMFMLAKDSDVEFILDCDVTPLKCEEVKIPYIVKYSELAQQEYSQEDIDPMDAIMLSKEDLNIFPKDFLYSKKFNKGGLYLDDGEDTSTEESRINKITKIARAQYEADGPNQWPHINRVLREGYVYCKLLKIEMPDTLYAAILFHDCAKGDSKKDHGKESAKKAKPLLESFFTKQELSEILIAIAEHNNNKPGTSQTSELLKAADANILDIAWFLSKLYWKRKNKGMSEDIIYKDCLETIQKGYLTFDHDGAYRPKYWAMRYEKELPKAQQTIAALTEDAVKKMIKSQLAKTNNVPSYEAIKEAIHSNVVKQIVNGDDISTESEHMRKSIREIVESNKPENTISIGLENLDISTEAAGAISTKKKAILDYICKYCDIMDPSKLNSTRYRKMISGMTDKQFDTFMHDMRDGKFQLHIVAPNMKVNLKVKDMIAAADALKLKLFHRIWMRDNATGRKFLSDNEYLVVKLPIRRQEQFIDKKMSVPDNDRSIDGLTGQVSWDSKACAITNPEIQILAARNMDATLFELVNVRGGNINSYAELKRSLEENGEARLNDLDPSARSRVAIMGGVLLTAMLIDSNL